MDFGKGALVCTSFATHIHSLTIALYGFSVGRVASDRDDAIKAFLIIAFLLYVIAFLIQVINKVCGEIALSLKILGVIVLILLFLAGIYSVSYLTFFCPFYN